MTKLNTPIGFKVRIMERKRSSGFRRIFTVAFDLEIGERLL